MRGGAGRPQTGSGGASQSSACTLTRFVAFKGPWVTSEFPRSSPKRSTLWRQFSRASGAASVAITEHVEQEAASAKAPTPHPAPSSTTRFSSKSLLFSASHRPNTTAAAQTPRPVRSVAPLPSPNASVALSAMGSSRIRTFSPRVSV